MELLFRCSQSNNDEENFPISPLGGRPLEHVSTKVNGDLENTGTCSSRRPVKFVKKCSKNLNHELQKNWRRFF